jgi:hypothetical protein
VLLVVGVVALVVAVATYLTWIASRLDRLAVRVESLWATLDGLLTARAFAAHDLAHEIDDPELHTAARAAGTAEAPEREAAENRLSRALRLALPDEMQQVPVAVPVGASTAVPPVSNPTRSLPAPRDPLSNTSLPRVPARRADDPALADLPASAQAAAGDLEVVLAKVSLARHFYNDAVRDLLVLRGRRLPRLLHLYGRAKAPSYFEFDSVVPERRTSAS